MKTSHKILVAGAVLAGTAACIVPPSMFEQASWSPSGEYWQNQGRYRQTPPETAVAPAEQRPAHADVGAAEHPPAGVPAVPPEQSVPEMEMPLYSWDGGVVDGAPQGRVATEQGAPRGVEAPPAGRMHIIELYQQVLDERDALTEEVELLRASLAQVTAAYEAKNEEARDLSDRVQSLESAHSELMNDNKAIAARLVQAQIRRLEAEKMLLETRIEVERARAEEAALSQAARNRVAPRSQRGQPEGSVQE